MWQPSGTLFPFQLSYLQTRRNGKHQMQEALTQKSVEHCKGTGMTELCLHICYLITECQRNHNHQFGDHKENCIKVNTKVRKMSQARDTGYLAGAPLGAIEGSQCDHGVHIPLYAYLFSVHFNSSYPVSFPLTYSCAFLSFIFLLPQYLQVPSGL